MQIKLKWVNKNDNAAVVEVFRSTATINTASPGAPLVTLPGTANTYIDTTVVYGTQYYYAVAISKAGKKLFTPVKTFTNIAQRGHGSNQLLYGDDRLGYFGMIGPDDFIEPAKALGQTAAFAAAFRTNWHKYVRKGKIIFLADRPMIGASGNVMYAQNIRRKYGLCSGLTWNFANTQMDVSKTHIIEKDGYSYHFRALRCLPDDWNGSAITAPMIADPTTEFNELMSTVIVGNYLPNKIGIVRGNQTRVVDMSSIACAEMQGTTHLDRLFYPTGNIPTATWTGPAPYINVKDAFLNHALRADNTNLISSAPADASRIWPAFELIE